MTQGKYNKRKTHKMGGGGHRGGALLIVGTSREEPLEGIVLQLDAQRQRGIPQAQGGAEGLGGRMQGTLGLK